MNIGLSRRSRRLPNSLRKLPNTKWTLIGILIAFALIPTIHLHHILQQNEDYYSYIEIIDLSDIVPSFSKASHSNTTFHNSSSSLRFDWTNVPPMTPLGRRFEETQSRCLNSSYIEEHGPVEVYQSDMRPSGMGSSLHLWMDPLCHASLNNKIRVTGNQMWLWNDQSQCPEIISRSLQLSQDKGRSQESALWCYFGHHESGLRCPPGTINWTTVQNPPDGFCGPSWVKTEEDRGTLLAGVVEWLFQNMTKLVIDEAERQIHEAFPISTNQYIDKKSKATPGKFPKWPGLPPSENLITVHIRWGDKAREMKLATIDELINATQSLLTAEEISGESTVHIYVASEDPRGLKEFTNAAKPNWIIHSSGPKIDEKQSNEMMESGIRTEGRAGLESLAALLISMESNRFVLTRASNWSRLMDELRKNVVNPRCNNCTKMINLRRGEY
eukprot:scaffold27515_cov45-Cyclotella_meneghiniana.AAC.2